jgi:hypothetical protein
MTAIVDRAESALVAAAARWNTGAAAPSPGLAPARAAAHWAAQLVAAVGWTLATPEPDRSHSAFEWVEAEGALLGVPVERGGRTAVAGLRLGDLTLFALGRASSQREELPLPGRTLEAGLAWLGGALGRILGTPIPRLERPHHELPPDPVGAGVPFGTPEVAALRELAAWFSSADRVLRAVATWTPQASPVRCWPHHFDIATLIGLDNVDAPEGSARSIGVGLSPGDGSYAEPYWYVTPSPPPDAGEMPPLPTGHWHIQGWFGAVLLASELAAAETATAGARVATFLTAAISAAGGDLVAAPALRRDP